MVVGVLPRPPCLFFFKIGDPIEYSIITPGNRNKSF